VPNEEQHIYDVNDAVSIETVAEPEDTPLPAVDAAELEVKYLLGASFPASKSDVVAIAEGNDAPKRVLDLLGRLEEQTYANVTELLAGVEELSGEHRQIEL